MDDENTQIKEEQDETEDTESESEFESEELNDDDFVEYRPSFTPDSLTSTLRQKREGGSSRIAYPPSAFKSKPLPRAVEPREQIQRFKEEARTNPILKQEHIKFVDSRADLFIKLGFLIMLGVFIYFVANGSFKSSFNTEVNPFVNITQEQNYENNFYNNFSTQPQYTINNNLNATISLPQSIINALAIIVNISNHTNST